MLQTVDSEHIEEFYELYRHDFVKSVYRSKHGVAGHNDLELKVSMDKMLQHSVKMNHELSLQLISDALNNAVHCSQFQHKSLTSMIAALHVAYGTSQSQLLWFSQLVSHSPGIMHSLEGLFPPKETADLVCKGTELYCVLISYTLH